MKAGKKPMAKQPEPSPINTGLMVGVIRSFLGDFSVKVDRQARLVTIQAKGQEYIYTYEQLVDELEKMINGSQ
jgi:hypothetical protein